MNSALLTPPRIYLDTRDLVYLTHIKSHRTDKIPAKHQQAYRQLLRWFEDGICTLVFNFTMMLEWIEKAKTNRNALEIVQIFESASNVYQIEMDRITYKLEIVWELQHIGYDLGVEKFEILKPAGTRLNGFHALRDSDPEVKSALIVEGKPVGDEQLTLKQLVESTRYFVDNKPEMLRE